MAELDELRTQTKVLIDNELSKLRSQMGAAIAGGIGLGVVAAVVIASAMGAEWWPVSCAAFVAILAIVVIGSYEDRRRRMTRLFGSDWRQRA